MTDDSPRHDASRALDSTRIPAHVGIIMDGNGRWAQARGLSRSAGHRAGVENLRPVLEAAGEFGIRFLTLYAFSTENWSRPAAEVRALLLLAQSVIDRELDGLAQRGVRLRHLGRREGLEQALLRRLDAAEERTRDNDALTLNIAFNYGGRAEIVDASRLLVRDGVPAHEITEELISSRLATAGQPDLDLVIRTAGEMRLSNFMIWQAAYAEYYSTSTLWPDFGRDDLLLALQAYQSRRRRFGGLDQVS
ncbi:MAG: di-trans,poly-cis-decaprenylcistransferase [Chloroflexi bacterium]|nr:di-trans,poly-cis-decaprenylcistransferase [Chloroflexota bacterium]